MPFIASTQSVDGRRLVVKYVNNVIYAWFEDHIRWSWNNTRFGVDFPSWRSVIRQGGNATTPLIATRRDVFAIPYVAELIYFGNNNPIDGARVMTKDSGTMLGNDPGSPAAFDASSSDTTARESFIKQYRKRRTQFQSGVFLGELMQTVRMIRRPALALRQAVAAYHRNLKNRLRRSRTDYRRVVQDSWLEFSFGVRPLVGDVEDACKLASASPERYLKPIRALGGQSFVTANTTVGTGYGFLGYLVQRVSTTEISVIYLGAASANITAPSFPEQLGLSWSNILPTAYELMPWSFLIDYFSNVGKVIEGISTGIIHLSWGCRTTRKICRQDVSVRADYKQMDATFGSRTYHAYATGSGRGAEYVDLSRSTLQAVGLGLSDVRFKLPGSDIKWLNIGALLRRS